MKNVLAQVKVKVYRFCLSSISISDKSNIRVFLHLFIFYQKF